MRRNFLVVGGAVLVIVAGAAAWHVTGSTAAATRAASARSQSAPIPVSVGSTERKDVPVYLSGLGTVQAYNTVTVKARVDGQIDRVAFTEGQDVKAGDVLVQIDPRPFRAALELAQATKARDQAQLDNAKLDYQRYIKGGPLVNTQQQIDTQAALVRQLEATVQADQANIDAAQVQLDYTTIKAPISGRTGVRLVDEGNIVHAADTTGLVVITQLQPISVIFTLPENQLQDVIREMAAGPLTVVARDDAGRTLDTGTLELVDNVIDQTSGSVRLKATFPNKSYSLWPGQYVNIRLLLKTLPQVVTAPSTAVQRGPDGMFVYVVRPDSSVAVQPVDVTRLGDGMAVIAKGLDPGARIVVSGQSRLQPGYRIKATGATAAAAGKS